MDHFVQLGHIQIHLLPHQNLPLSPLLSLKILVQQQKCNLFMMGQSFAFFDSLLLKYI
jgi:hypothetical protein